MEIISGDDCFRVLDKQEYIFFYFTASWCGPCQRIKSTVYNLFEKMDIKCMMIEIDVDECPEISSALKIKVLPTFIIQD